MILAFLLVNILHSNPSTLQAVDTTLLDSVIVFQIIDGDTLWQASQYLYYDNEGKKKEEINLIRNDSIIRRRSVIQYLKNGSSITDFVFNNKTWLPEVVMTTLDSSDIKYQLITNFYANEITSRASKSSKVDPDGNIIYINQIMCNANGRCDTSITESKYDELGHIIRQTQFKSRFSDEKRFTMKHYFYNEHGQILRTVSYQGNSNPDTFDMKSLDYERWTTHDDHQKISYSFFYNNLIRDFLPGQRIVSTLANDSSYFIRLYQDYDPISDNWMTSSGRIVFNESSDKSINSTIFIAGIEKGLPVIQSTIHKHLNRGEKVSWQTLYIKRDGELCCDHCKHFIYGNQGLILQESILNCSCDGRITSTLGFKRYYYSEH